MSGYLKINSNLFLEVAELNRNDQFLDEWGYRRHVLANSKTYGIVKDLDLPETGTILTRDAFYVSKFGVACYDKVIINPGMIIDILGRYVVNEKPVDVMISPDSNWYWLRVKHKYSVKELGTISVDSLGNVVGVGTEFTKILRGQPNFPSKIRFLNSTLGNAADYEVVSVNNDNSIILQGAFIPETGLQFAVVGTFTPGYPVPVPDELIFQYDSFEYELVLETTLNQAPAFVQDEEFYLARIKSNGITILVEDKRTDWWRPWGEWWLDFVDRNLNNKLIGVEGVQYQQPNEPRAKNITLLAWGMRFSIYTIDPSLKKISVLIGLGGTYKDTSFFNSGDFNDWRLYAKNGTWRTIIDSQKTGTQIVLTLDVLNPDDYGTADGLFIAPPYERIEIRAIRDGAIIDTLDQDQDTDITEVFPWPNLERTFEFPINTQLARLELPALDGCYKYNLMYRYIVFEAYTDWLVFPNDPIGHYDEESYDDFGNLKLPIDRTQIPYVGSANLGFIKVCEAPDSFQNFQEEVRTGDLFGVRTTSIANSTPVLDLEVGVDKKYQHFIGALTATADIYINLKTTGAREGNTFWLHIDQWIVMNTFKLRLVEDYVNPTSFTLIHEFSPNDLIYARNNTSNDASQSHRLGLFITCTYDDTGKWIARFDTDLTPKGTVRMINAGAGIVTTNFDGTGYGVKRGFWGWHILNGQDFFTDMTDRFPMGTVSGTPGTTGGSNSIVLSTANLPEHRHSATLTGGTTSNGAHVHELKSGNGTSGGGWDKGEWDDRQTYDMTQGEHSHSVSVSGFTDFAGGSGSPTPVDTRPSWARFIFIEKYV